MAMPPSSTSCFAVLGLLLIAANGWGAESTDLVVADFEGKDFGAWRAAGTAFNQGPARDAQLNKLEIENYRGRGAASSELDGDKPMGILTSPGFKIEK